MATKPVLSATQAKQRRDVTRALTIAKGLDAMAGSERLENHRDETRELVAILTAIDARTGRRDPSQRARKSAKRSAKRPAKKARARR